MNHVIALFMSVICQAALMSQLGAQLDIALPPSHSSTVRSFGGMVLIVPFFALLAWVSIILLADPTCSKFARFFGIGSLVVGFGIGATGVVASQLSWHWFYVLGWLSLQIQVISMGVYCYSVCSFRNLQALSHTVTREVPTLATLPTISGELVGLHMEKIFQ